MDDRAEKYSDEETAARRDATIKRMIAMPPKPHSEMKVGRKSVTPKRAKVQPKKPKNAKKAKA
jgi:hypothetical protein